MDLWVGGSIEHLDSANKVVGITKNLQCIVAGIGVSEMDRSVSVRKYK